MLARILAVYARNKRHRAFVSSQRQNIIQGFFIGISIAICLAFVIPIFIDNGISNNQYVVLFGKVWSARFFFLLALFSAAGGIYYFNPTTSRFVHAVYKLILGGLAGLLGGVIILFLRTWSNWTIFPGHQLWAAFQILGILLVFWFACSPTAYNRIFKPRKGAEWIYKIVIFAITLESLYLGIALVIS